MTPPDLTRWNRAGLTRLDYVDGNAATYLETLRESLRARFPDDRDVQRWLGDPANDASLHDWHQRLLEQYQGPRRDHAWELLRALARAVHVLARTTNAYANERFLGTATQWDNLRRLVAMLDYQPAPPGSAETWLALLAREGTPGGRVEAGVAVQNDPDDGSDPLTFETLDALDVDPRLNLLRAPDHDHSPAVLTLPPVGTLGLSFESLPPDLAIGDAGLLTAGDLGLAVRVDHLAPGALTLTALEATGETLTLPLADLSLQLQPRWHQPASLNGAGVIGVDTATGLQAGEVLAYADGSGYRAVRVEAVDGRRLRLAGTLPPAGAELLRTQSTDPIEVDGSLRFVLPLPMGHHRVWDENLASRSTRVHSEDGQPSYRYRTAGSMQRAHFLPAHGEPCCRVIETLPTALHFAGSPGSLAPGQWLQLVDTDGQRYSRRVVSVEADDQGFDLAVTDLPDRAWQRIEGRYRHTLKDARRFHNATSLFLEQDGQGLGSRVTVGLEAPVAALAPGRTLLLCGPERRVPVSLVGVDYQPDAGTARLTLRPPQPVADFPRSGSHLHGNLVRAGHGESRDPVVIGSGDRSLAGQRFPCRRRGLAFVRDSGFTSGVRAAVRVFVEGREWTQVDDLQRASPTDTHFEVRLDEDGEAWIGFGDGRHGQRLPTGRNNVTLRTRLGNGLAGNLPAGSLETLARAHERLDGVRQPLPAVGGSQHEPGEALREQAPASVLTLGRAVSVRDFQALARRHAGVWQAHARPLRNRPGASDCIEITVVPAGGGDLGELAEDLARTLTRHASPGMAVAIRRYEGLLLELEVQLGVDTAAYATEEVVARVEETLLATLSLERMRLGAPLYRSTLLALMESVPGVEHVGCRINPHGFRNDRGEPGAPAHRFTAGDGSLRRISPRPDQLVYLDVALAPPQITAGGAP
ncbi:hypothetical protein [Halomonas sp. C05BenzN]|uniref:hypothetical protein n=1 Tax=Halomonas sp. C05BenzN TaxID=3411041 RepID=UPI003B9548E6